MAKKDSWADLDKWVRIIAPQIGGKSRKDTCPSDVGTSKRQASYLNRARAIDQSSEANLGGQVPHVQIPSREEVTGGQFQVSRRSSREVRLGEIPGPRKIERPTGAQLTPLMGDIQYIWYQAPSSPITRWRKPCDIATTVGLAPFIKPIDRVLAQSGCSLPNVQAAQRKCGNFLEFKRERER